DARKPKEAQEPVHLGLDPVLVQQPLQILAGDRPQESLFPGPRLLRGVNPEHEQRPPVADLLTAEWARGRSHPGRGRRVTAATRPLTTCRTPLLPPVGWQARLRLAKDFQYRLAIRRRQVRELLRLIFSRQHFPQAQMHPLLRLAGQAIER